MKIRLSYTGLYEYFEKFIVSIITELLRINWFLINSTSIAFLENTSVARNEVLDVAEAIAMKAQARQSFHAQSEKVTWKVKTCCPSLQTLSCGPKTSLLTIYDNMTENIQLLSAILCNSRCCLWIQIRKYCLNLIAETEAFTGIFSKWKVPVKFTFTVLSCIYFINACHDNFQFSAGFSYETFHIHH